MKKIDLKRVSTEDGVVTAEVEWLDECTTSIKAFNGIEIDIEHDDEECRDSMISHICGDFIEIPWKGTHSITLTETQFCDLQWACAEVNENELPVMEAVGLSIKWKQQNTETGEYTVWEKEVAHGTRNARLWTAKELRRLADEIEGKHDEQ